MAQRRMFTKSITNSSEFLMMPPTAQLLYIHFGMNADDDGFCEIFPIMRMTDSKPDDLTILKARKFVKIFDDKVLLITSWREHNYIRPDTFKPSKYLEIYKNELKLLAKESEKPRRRLVDGTSTQDKISKDKISKDKISKDNTTTNVVAGKPVEYGNQDINFLISYIKEKLSLNKLDGSEKENRRFAFLAIKKFGSKERVAELIDIAAGDKFWSAQVSSMKQIYYNGVKIALSLKSKLKNYVEYERIK